MLNQPLLSKHTLDGYKYEVFWDPDFQVDGDFENEEQKEEFILKIECGYLSAFGVVKYKVCECCCMWSEMHSMWGFVCETAEEALEEYMNQFNDE